MFDIINRKDDGSTIKRQLKDSAIEAGLIYVDEKRIIALRRMKEEYREHRLGILTATRTRRIQRCHLSAVLASSRGPSTVCLALSNLPHQRVHIGEVPDLGELAVFDAIKSELRNSHPTIGRLNSLEGPLVGTGDREVTRDIVAVDDQVPYLPMPVRKCGEQRRQLVTTYSELKYGPI
jgi:hypothetical protein